MPDADVEPEPCRDCGKPIHTSFGWCHECDRQYQQSAQIERHDVPHEPPRCAQGWCCGCDEHPVGKPWGWNVRRWDEHYAAHHTDPTEPF